MLGKCELRYSQESVKEMIQFYFDTVTFAPGQSPKVMSITLEKEHHSNTGIATHPLLIIEVQGATPSAGARAPAGTGPTTAVALVPGATAQTATARAVAEVMG